MIVLFIVFAIVACVLLVLVILAQNPKGGGVSSQFGGSGTPIMGVKKTGDILEKMTWGFVIFIMVMAITTNLTLKDMDGESGQPDMYDIEGKGSEDNMLRGLESIGQGEGGEDEGAGGEELIIEDIEDIEDEK